MYVDMYVNEANNQSTKPVLYRLLYRLSDVVEPLTLVYHGKVRRFRRTRADADTIGCSCIGHVGHSRNSTGITDRRKSLQSNPSNTGAHKKSNGVHRRSFLTETNQNTNKKKPTQ